MPTRARRTEKLDLRLTPQAKEKIAAAAAVSQTSVTEFVLKSALYRADETLMDQRLFILNEEQFAAFEAALDAPPRVLPGLKKLMERKAPWE
jgi:uncharacterized protein (DUF1778 family)